ncbi:MAG: hypothetical protein K9G57_00275 [Ignavibacteriales bacterium]|nr:hypothetical protein [Ignavibacteriales bacterium]
MKKVPIIILLFIFQSIYAQKYPPVPVPDGTRFFLSESQVDFLINSVAVAGTFNNWNKDQYTMQKTDEPGIWAVTVPLESGIEYHYKIVLNDSLWMTDPNAPDITEDEWRNGVIVPQKYGAPYIASITPPHNKRIEDLDKIIIKLASDKSPINPASIAMSLDGKEIAFTFDEYNSLLTASMPDSLNDGEHRIILKFSDMDGNHNDGITSTFFLDRFIKEITTPVFYDSAVIYEIFIRTFMDSNGDGIGDFNGLTSRLGYLRDTLGINTLWLMPWNESTTDHGYNVVDYYSIEKDYGSFEEYLRFLEAARSKGIKVVMDFVINHTDSTHKFFQNAYKNPASSFTPWYQFLNIENSDWNHFGVERKMPKLDFSNPEVQDYFIKVAKFWLDPDQNGDFSDGVDGFRCDAAKEVPHQFWNRFRKEIKSFSPSTLLLGEVWDNSFFLIPFFKEEFDMLFAYPFYYSLEKYIKSNDLNSIQKRILEEKEIYPSGFQMTRFLANHDNNRAFTFAGSDTAKYLIMNFITFTLPGTPMIYYGDELMFEGKLPPENVRQNMEWDKVSANYLKSGSALTFTRNLISLRKKYTALSERNDSKTNSLFFLEHKNSELLAFLRYNENEKLFIIINNSSEIYENPEFKKSETIQFHSAESIFSHNAGLIELNVKDQKEYFCLEGLILNPYSFILVKIR